MKGVFKALKCLPIEDVWGLGRQLSKQLLAKDCNTAYDCTQLSDVWVQKNFSVVESKLKRDLQGIPTLKLDEIVTQKKMIATTRSFDYSYSDIEYIKERVATFAVSCAEKLRKQGSSCYVIIVMLKSDKHKKELEQHRISTSVNLTYPTNSSLIISNCAISALMSIFKKGIQYKKAGVSVTGLVPMDNHQLHLFDQENPKHEPLMKSIDSINAKYTNNKVKIAHQDLKHT